APYLRQGNARSRTRRAFEIFQRPALFEIMILGTKRATLVRHKLIFESPLSFVEKFLPRFPISGEECPASGRLTHANHDESLL
ncbi:hypothetical protein ACP0F6_25845, partial [Escherichia coli]|uniref:hypothetical protein n=1 Tax=Escherichia coli TaxID=562 RepID=UPI003CF91FF9